MTRRLFASVSVMALLMGHAAASDVNPESESYYGPIPPPSDSTTARFEQGRTPVWQAVVDFPFYVTMAPPYLLTKGVETSANYVVEHPNVARTVQNVIFPAIGPLDGRLSLVAGSLSGIGVGYSGRDIGSRHGLKLGGTWTSTGRAKAVFGAYFDSSPSTRLSFGLGYRRRPNVLYFGIGPFAGSGSESWWTQEVGWGGVSIARQIGGNTSIETGILVSGVTAIGPDSNTPELLDRITPESGETPLGYGGRSDGLGYSIDLINDDTDTPGRPSRGGIRRARAVYYQDNDKEAENFWTYRFEAQQFFGLPWHTVRTFAVRGMISWIDAADSDNISFQRLMTNDDPDLMRGFRDNRWWDEGIAGVSAEYRWPVLSLDDDVNGAGVDAYLFAEAGQVFAHFEQISRENARSSIGGGFRWASPGNYHGRLEIAKSREEWVFRIGSDQIFQYAKNGLFHGRNPIPPR